MSLEWSADHEAGMGPALGADVVDRAPGEDYLVQAIVESFERCTKPIDFTWCLLALDSGDLDSLARRGRSGSRHGQAGTVAAKVRGALTIDLAVGPTQKVGAEVLRLLSARCEALYGPRTIYAPMAA